MKDAKARESWLVGEGLELEEDGKKWTLLLPEPPWEEG